MGKKGFTLSHLSNICVRDTQQVMKFIVDPDVYVSHDDAVVANCLPTYVTTSWSVAALHGINKISLLGHHIILTTKILWWFSLFWIIMMQNNIESRTPDFTGMLSDFIQSTTAWLLLDRKSLIHLPIAPDISPWHAIWCGLKYDSFVYSALPNP